MFHKVDWFIRYYDGTKFSVLFDRLVGLKSGITWADSHNYAKID